MAERPDCGSKKVWRAGTHKNRQRWQCRQCGRRFMEPIGDTLNVAIENIHTCPVCVTQPKGAKNLVGVETQEQQLKRGSTKDFRGRIVEFLWHLKKQGFPETTIKTYEARIRRLHHLGTDLMNPEAIKLILAQQNKWTNSYKMAMVSAYDHWCKLFNLSWKKPRYRRQNKLPFIPTEEEIDQLIAGCGKKTATFLQLLKETAIRYREGLLLKWLDVDFKRESINITSAKHGIPRELRISEKLIRMLQRLPRTSERVFGDIGYSAICNNFKKQRMRIAEKLQNPRLLRITCHTLRHWKASIEYHRGAKLIEIKEMLGHNNIQSTMVYTHLIKPSEKEDYISRATRSVTGARALIEAGFQYVTDMDGLKLFRKRK